MERQRQPGNLLLATSRLLVLQGAANLLGTVLLLLALLAPALGGSGEALTDHAVLGLKLLERLHRVVDEGEAGGLATAKGVLAPKDDNVRLVGLVEAGQAGGNVELGDTSSTRVENVDDLIQSVSGPSKRPICTICLRARRRLVMNLRVRMVTGASAAYTGGTDEINTGRPRLCKILPF